MRVSHVMKSDVVYVRPESSLNLARKIMREFGIQHLPVVDRGNLVGILSESDILLASTLRGQKIDTPDQPVADVMSRNVITCFPTTPISDVVTTMISLQISCIPVVVDMRVIGIVTSHDLLKLLAVASASRRMANEVDLQGLRSA